MRLKSDEYDDSLISSTSNFIQSWFSLTDWWIQALFMTMTKRDSKSFEVHWERTLICIKSRKIVLIMKSWCIFHVIYLSIIYVNSMLHLFDHLSIWLTCREISTEAQSYFQSFSQWISIKEASSVDLNLSVHSHAALSFRNISWFAVQSVRRNFHFSFKISLRWTIVHLMSFLLHFHVTISLNTVLWSITMLNSSNRNQIISS